MSKATEIFDVDNSSGIDEVDLGDFMSMMDVVDIQRRQSGAVQEQLNVDEQKAAVRDRLRKTYHEMGVNVNDAQLERAIEAHYSTRWEFKPPKDGLETTLAGAYVARNWIATRVVAPVMALGLAVAGVSYSVNAAKAARELANEKAVEAAVETAYASREATERRISSLLESQFYPQLPENERGVLQGHVSEARNELAETDPFFREFCPEGVSDDAVTPSNYPQIKQNLVSATSVIDAAEGEVREGETILQNQQKYIILDRQLNDLAIQIRSLSPPETLANRAETLYQNGLSSIKHRQIGKVEESVSRLSQVKQDVVDLSYLVDKANQTHTSISKIVKDSRARQEGASLFEEARVYAESANVANLRNTVQQLEELQAVLNQDYKIELVQRPGIITGLFREDKNSPYSRSAEEDPRGKAFYVVVHAVGKNGNELSLPIKDEEDGSTRRVSIWAERVPFEVYERVKGDKKDNGLLDNSNDRRFDNRYFGAKEKGYLEAEVTLVDNRGRPLEREGQLNQEEYNWRSD